MARIHRCAECALSCADPSDGQKKAVFIYRLLTVNTIDEKIYQVRVLESFLLTCLAPNYEDGSLRPDVGGREWREDCQGL